MLLQFSDGEPFATGGAHYEYRPATDDEITNRLIIRVAVENVITQAVVDTGAPYSIIAPRIARLAGLNKVEPLERITMLVRGMRLQGGTIRVNMTLPADLGQELTVDATAFIPDVEEYWGEFPSFIGQNGFLDRIRYAVDSDTDMLYFGELP